MSTSSKENIQEIIDDIKKNLTRGVKDRKHAFHTPVFCNINEDGSVESRVIVLRKFDTKNMVINFHTDYRSPKVDNLKKNNKTMFVFYDIKSKIQMRIKTVTNLNNQNEIAKEMWIKTKRLSRKCYLINKSPSSITTLPEDAMPQHLVGKEPGLEESEKGFKNFTVVQNKIKEIDWLYLNASGHRRLKINFMNTKKEHHWLIP